MNILSLFVYQQINLHCFVIDHNNINTVLCLIKVNSNTMNLPCTLLVIVSQTYSVLELYLYPGPIDICHTVSRAFKLNIQNTLDTNT